MLARLDERFDGLAPQAEQAARLIKALGPERLLPVTGLLAARGDLGPLGSAVAVLAVRPEQGMAPGWLDAERDICAALVAAGVDALALKGALLAYTVYPSPAARLRTDTDLLVPPSQVEAAIGVLRQEDYTTPYAATGKAYPTQQMWVRRRDGYHHIVDLHWDLSQHPALMGLLDPEHLVERAVGLDRLAPGVRGLSPGDALLHACIHYFGHQRREHHPLQWVLDVDLLWRQSSDDERDACIERAEKIGIAGLLAALLAKACDAFRTPVDPDRLAGLTAIGSRQWRTQLIVPVESSLRDLVLTLRSEPTWGRRIYRLWRMVCQLWRRVFPRAAYMRQRHPNATAATLPFHYLTRIVVGVRKAMVRRPPGW